MQSNHYNHIYLESYNIINGSKAILIDVSEKEKLIYFEAERLISLCVTITVQEKQCVAVPPNSDSYKVIN